MRISFVNKPHPSIQGLAATLAYCGHEVCMWDRTKKSVFDMFTEVRPDIVVILRSEINDALAEATVEFGSKTVVLEMPGIFEPFLAYSPDPASNPVQFGRGTYQEKYDSDLLYFSYVDHGPIMDFVDLLSIQKRVKFFGPKRIHYPQYLGNLSSLAEYANALKSTKLFVDVDGFMIMNAALLEVKAIGFGLNPVLYPENLFPSFNDVAELTNKVVNVGEGHLKEAKEFAKNNTFFHRAEELLNQLGYNNEAQEVIGKWNQIASAF